MIGHGRLPSAEHPRALAKARLERPVALLADIIAEFAPQVVITYDKAEPTAIPTTCGCTTSPPRPCR